jgi:integrase
MSASTPIIRTQRDSLLPCGLDTFARLGLLEKWYRWLWLQAPLKLDPADTDLLRVYVSLLVDSAIAHAAALDCLLHLCSSPISKPYCSVTIPICRTDRSSRGIELSFNETTSRAIRYWLERRTKEQFNHGTVSTNAHMEIEQKLKSQFAHAQSVEDCGNALKFRDLQVLGPLMAIRNGAEPYLIAAVDSKIRPTSQSPLDPYYLLDVKREFASHMLDRYSAFTLRSEARRKEFEEDSPPSEESPPERIGQSRKLLRELCGALERAHSGQVSSDVRREKALSIIEQYKSLALHIAPPDSALVLAIDYAEHHYVKRGKIKARSFRNYLDRAVINGLLDSEASFSLSDWDTDDFIDNVEERISDPRLGANSRRLILDAYSPLLKFLTKRLGIPPIEITELRQAYVAGSGQWAVISPHAIDKVIRCLFGHGDYRFRQVAVVIALAYYGGLRASEARRLTLANVVMNDRLDILDIEVLRGKTPNARRRLPLAILAPPHIVEMIRSYWNERRAEFADPARLGQIALFGPQRMRDRYLYQAITRLGREMLKEFLGETLTLHALRHCFCTLLFLRWYAIRHRDITDDLRDRSHAIYQPKLMARLSDFFAVMPEEDGEIRPYDLVSMTKLTGHASPETLFQFYVHSFSVVQAHAVRNIKSPVSGAVMSDALRRALVPRRRSSSSRARDNERHL